MIVIICRVKDLKLHKSACQLCSLTWVIIIHVHQRHVCLTFQYMMRQSAGGCPYATDLLSSVPGTSLKATSGGSRKLAQNMLFFGAVSRTS